MSKSGRHLKLDDNVRRANAKQKCKECGELKSLSEFNPNKNYENGVLARCKVCKNAYSRRMGFAGRYAKINAEKIKAYQKEWRVRNKERYDLARRNWVRKNKKKVLAETRKYQAAKLKRTPRWLNKVHHIQIRDFYIKCPDGFEVDHVIPLQGKLASGLHVPWNLQYLRRTENRRKSNKH